MIFDFLVESYATEREKVLSVWSQFRDEDLSWRPPDPQRRGRSVLEQFVHQCVSEDLWFKNMLGIDLAQPALPEKEARLEFLRVYADRSRKTPAKIAHSERRMVERRDDILRGETFARMGHGPAHDAHEPSSRPIDAYLRVLGRDVWSTYGPTSDTGGLMINKAPVVYPYETMDALLHAEESGGAKCPLPGIPKDKSFTERP